MQALQKILVGLDLHHGDRIVSDVLEETSQAALNQAVEIAVASGAAITLCAVLEISEQALHLIEVDKHNVHRTVEDIAKTDLEKIAASLSQHGINVNTKLVLGKAWEELTREAVRGGFDLVIVGTRRRSATARALFGSTCNKLMRVCPAPVWVVKPGEVRDLREVAVATDFSDIGQQVTDTGVSVAKYLAARLFVVHTLEFPFESYLHTAGIPEQEVKNYRLRMHAEAEEKVRAQLDQSDYRTVEQGVKVELIEGSPDAAIPQFIDDNSVDLLIIGSHGRSGFSGMLLGNTAERLLPHVHCSVMVVKPANFVCPVPV